MGQNGRWRRAMVDHVVPAARRLVLDVASGPAGVALQLADRTGGRVVGLDLTEADAAPGPAQRGRRGLADRVQLVPGRAEQLPFADATFDALTFTYLLRYVDDPAATLEELARVVKPGGAVANLEFLVPTEPVLAVLVVGLHPLVLPVGGLVTGAGPGSTWAGSSARTSPPTTAATRWTGPCAPGERAGFVDVGSAGMSLGGGLVMWGRRAGG